MSYGVSIVSTLGTKQPCLKEIFLIPFQSVIKSPQSGVTLNFQFVSAAVFATAASPAAATFVSQV